ncbi:MAG TPA: tape measure protein, partial [Phnomibacter sp.]|nr:tape measure protein [Phnomibacter sp.]
MATNILQYTIALKDMLSSKMRSIAAVSQKAIGDMERISKGYADTIKRGAGNVSQLQNALQRLQNGRNGIDAGTAAGIRHVRAYNSEIRRLEGNIRRLNTINGSRVKTWAADALNQLPGAGLMRNPLVMALTTGLFAGRAAMQADKTRTSMRTLVGERAGDQLYGELDKYARDTIWGKEVHDNAQTMLGFGISANKVMPYTRMLADVSMGDKNKLNSLTLAFSQIQAAGKLTGQDLLQLINAGFNPLGVISEKTGKSIGVLKKEMEDGAITADMVTAAFESATGPMGRYYQMTQKIANTPFGKFEALKGQLEGIAVKIGTALLPSISKALGMAAKFFDFLVNRGPDIVGVLGVVGAALVVTNMQAVGVAIGVKG